MVAGKKPGKAKRLVVVAAAGAIAGGTAGHLLTARPARRPGLIERIVAKRVERTVRRRILDEARNVGPYTVGGAVLATAAMAGGQAILGKRSRRKKKVKGRKKKPSK